jgi:hypothetical protein
MQFNENDQQTCSLKVLAIVPPKFPGWYRIPFESVKKCMLGRVVCFVPLSLTGVDLDLDFDFVFDRP